MTPEKQHEMLRDLMLWMKKYNVSLHTYFYDCERLVICDNETEQGIIEDEMIQEAIGSNVSGLLTPYDIEEYLKIKEESK